MKVAFLVVERYISNAWQKYGVKRVIGDKNGFAFIQFSSATGLEGVLEHGPWLIHNTPFILKKWNPSSKLSKEELTYDPVWFKFHRVYASALTADGPSTISTRLGTPVMLDSCTRKGFHATLASKHSTLGNYSLPIQQVPKLAYQKKTNSTPMSNSFSALEEYNGTPMDDLFGGTKKKVQAPPRKTSIWSGRKRKYSSESSFTSPNPFYLITMDDGKSMLHGVQESDDDPDEEDDSDETTYYSKSLEYLFKINYKTKKDMMQGGPLNGEPNREITEMRSDGNTKEWDISPGMIMGNAAETRNRRSLLALCRDL
ncbi:reverse transcriptase domain-containing protein [Tanacetum coccineum]